MFTKTELQQGITLYTRKTEQFKTVNMSMKFKTNLTKTKAANRSVLANILEDSNAVYPTQHAFRRKLDDLYGTVLYTDVSKRGSRHLLTLNLDCVNDEFLQEQGVLQQAIQLVETVLFEPNFDEGRFHEVIVEREKRSVTERIRSQFDDKTSYAQKRMLENLYPDSSVSTGASGSIESVEQVTTDSLMKAYTSLIHDDTIDIYVVGDIDEQEIIKQLTQILSFKARVPQLYQEPKLPLQDESTEALDIHEQLDMKQGKLHLTFTTPVNFLHPDYFKMQVMNGVFGGFAHSKLFMNVREKESMAYYASSAYASHYGLLYVMSGIDASLKEKAVSLILEQITAMQNGEITDLEINQTKALLRNSIRSAFDSARGQIEVFDQYKDLDEDFHPFMLIEKWDEVSKDDLQKLASQLELQIVYLLSGKEETVDA